MRKGESVMAYETKVIMTLLAERIARARTVKEAYTVVAKAAGVKGLKLPTYEETLKEFEAEGIV